MKKVSIIIPCYNSEKYVERLINSILNQTYKNLEVIFVNDGSNDKTEEIIIKYKKCFLNNNMEFKYLIKENGGQASALNKGLEIFTGEYLCWPDSDDFFLKDSIKEKVNFLEKNPKYSMVRTNSYVCSEDNLINPIGQICAEIGSQNHKENLFDEFILEKKVWYAPITFLIRSSVFLEVYPKRQIYVSEGSGSQNFQMLVPISLNNKWGYLDRKLSVYTFRKNSYSRQWNSLEKILIRYFYHEEILKKVIHNEKLIVDKIKYEEMIKIKYIRKRMQAAFKWGDKKKIKNEYKNLKDLKAINISDRIFYIKSLFPFMRFQYYILELLKQKIKIKKYNKISLKKQLEELNIIN